MSTYSSNSFASNLLDCLKNFQLEAKKFSKILILLYCIWRARNDTVFNNKLADQNKIIFNAAHLYSMYAEKSLLKDRNLNPNSSNISWTPPISDHIKLNFDVSVLLSNKAAAGFILRDSNGTPILASTKNLGKTNVLCAEAAALRAGLYVVMIHGYQRVQVEGDSKILIDCINNKCDTPWRIKTLVEDIKTIAANISKIDFRHVWREANFTADAVGQAGHSTNVASWSSMLPPLIAKAVKFDMLGIGCSRGSCL